MTNVYQVRIECMKPERRYWDKVDIRATNLAEVITIAGHYCEGLLANGVLSNCYEIRFEIDNSGQGHYVTDWDKVFPPSPPKEEEKCLHCKGSGQVEMYDGHHYKVTECPSCN
jgi:hypothetical protein